MATPGEFKIDIIDIGNFFTLYFVCVSYTFTQSIRFQAVAAEKWHIHRLSHLSHSFIHSFISGITRCQKFNEALIEFNFLFSGTSTIVVQFITW
jgi:hypothetical protein